MDSSTLQRTEHIADDVRWHGSLTCLTQTTFTDRSILIYLCLRGGVNSVGKITSTCKVCSYETKLKFQTLFQSLANCVTYTIFKWTST